MHGGLLDGEALTYEVPDHFDLPEAFACYEREFAPALRAEDLAKFPSLRGVSYRRLVGAVVVRIELGPQTG